VQAAIYLATLGVLTWQIILLRRQLRMQSKSIRASDYLRCQIDFTETLRLLVLTKLHHRVYDTLAQTGGSKFTSWLTYNQNEKAEYAYFELLYELLERIFVVWKEGTIDNAEWAQWHTWITDVIDNKVFRDVYEDNLGMFDPRFEHFIQTLLPSKPETPRPSQPAT
jgi:hypothetical protein